MDEDEEIIDDDLDGGARRGRNITRIVIALVVLAIAGWIALKVVMGREDAKVGQCEQNLIAINQMLDFYYHDLKLEAKTKRAAKFPESLQALVPQYVSSADKLRCPVHDVSYHYAPQRGGQGFFLFCPSRHRASYVHEPYYLVVTADEGLLRCFVRGGKVIKWTQVGDLQRGLLRDSAILFEEPSAELSAATLTGGRQPLR